MGRSDILDFAGQCNFEFWYYNNFISLITYLFPYNCCVENEQGIFEQVLRGDLDFSSDPWPGISERAKDLVRKMLVRDPRRRMTAHQVLCKYSSTN